MEAFKATMKDWNEIEVALAKLAESLGIAISPKDHPKGFYWSRTPLGDSLYDFLESLVQVGVLEENSDGLLRWNPSFPHSLENYYYSDFRPKGQTNA